MNSDFVSQYSQAQRQAYQAMNQALEELARIMRDSSSSTTSSSNELYKDLMLVSRRLDLDMTEIRITLERVDQLIQAQTPAPTSAEQIDSQKPTQSVAPTPSLTSEQMLAKIRNTIATSTSNEEPVFVRSRRTDIKASSRDISPTTTSRDVHSSSTKSETTKPKSFASSTETRIGLDYDWSTIPDQRFGMKMMHLGKKYTGLTNWNELYIKVLQGFHDYKHNVFKTRVLNLNAAGGQFVTSKKNLFIHSVTIGGLDFAIGLLPNQIRDNIAALYSGYDMASDEFGIYVKL